MKRIMWLVLVAIFLMSAMAYAETAPAFISAGTVTFNSVIVSGNNIITFNSVTKNIKLINLSPYSDCHVDFVCRDLNGKRGYTDNNIANSSGKLLLPALGRVSPNSVSIDFATRNLGFVKNGSGTTADVISYVVTGDSGSF